VSVDDDTLDVEVARVAGATFGQTHWSRISRLATPPSEDPATRRSWEDAWMYLWETFRPAMLSTVRATLSRIGGGVVHVEDAEDVVQSFLLACLEHNYLGRADSGMGRFRTFVAVCLRRHTVKFVEYNRRKRRTPTRPPRSLCDADLDAQDPAVTAQWDAQLQQEWTDCILAAALPRVAERSPLNRDLLEALIAQPAITVEEMALRLDIPPRKVPLRLHRARKMLAQEFWWIVKQSVSSDEELESERARLAGPLTRYLGAQDAPSLYG
jgi:RNA polymerase sigma factor (sigma-70 family)